MSDKIIDANDFLNDDEIDNADYSDINTLGLHVGDAHNNTETTSDYDQTDSNDVLDNAVVLPKYGFFLDAKPVPYTRPKTVTEILDEYLVSNNLSFKDIQDEVFDWCERKIKGE